MLNRIAIAGRLVQDPELRTTPGGTSVCTVRIACDRDYKNKQTGERETDFVNVVAFNHTAEFVSRNFSKGRMAVVDGRLQIRPYTDRDGNKRTVAEVVAENIYFGDSKREDNGYSPSSYSSGADVDYSAPGRGDDEFLEISDQDSDLPF